MKSTARLDAFARGAICALRAAGAKREDIARTVRKKDGKRPHLRAVDAVLARHRADPDWRGEDSRAGGRPRLLTQEQRQQLLELVFKERGSAKVTVPYCQRIASAKCAGKLRKTLVSRRRTQGFPVSRRKLKCN